MRIWRYPVQLIRAIARPEYVYRPIQLWRRLSSRVLRQEHVRLAWGLPIQVETSGYVSTDIVNVGLYERIVPECICRLLDPGEWAIDVGAHIGQNASVMALMAGPDGYVMAFEPHPTLRKLLQHNTERWRNYLLAPVEPVAKALSSRLGVANLYEDEHFARNRGSASLQIPSVAVRKHTVDLTTLDIVLPTDVRIGLMKLDVEGHEHAVLDGATQLLGSGRVRDIIFEDVHPQASRVAGGLERFGYSVFALSARWHKPCLIAAHDDGHQRVHTRNYLATRDPQRAHERFRRSGWRCLRLRARKLE